jgi:hypothetical protein
MATPVDPSEKANFIALVNVINPQEAIRLEEVFVNYEDLPTVIGRQLPTYASNNQYLKECMDVLNSAYFNAAGVYYNGAFAVPVTDPLLWINTTTTAGITFTADSDGFAILGSSDINLITLDAGVALANLYIGPGSSVDMLDSSNTETSPPTSPPVGTIVNEIWLPYLKSTPSTLKAVKFGSQIGQVNLSEGSYYGGLQDVDPELTCAIPVTAMQATEITFDSILVSWTTPANGYLFIVPFYKKTNSKTWIKCTDSDGDFVDDTGFIFRHLEKDTYYDFKAELTCVNGGRAVTEITTQTVCCGAGTSLQIYKTCAITIRITDNTDSFPVSQTLCNGAVIDLYYPTGTTITIPYLATVNCAVQQPFVIDNSNYQLMPFDASTGTWDASGTTIGSFIEGNVITVNVGLPA